MKFWHFADGAKVRSGSNHCHAQRMALGLPDGTAWAEIQAALAAGVAGAVLVDETTDLERRRNESCRNANEARSYRDNCGLAGAF